MERIDVPELVAIGCTREPKLKVILFANTDWYLYNFRRSLACALKERGHEVVLVSPPGPYGPKLEEMGFRWVRAPMERRSLNPLKEIALIEWLRRLMVREKASVIHAFTIKCAVYGSLAGRLAGTPARVSAVTGLGYVFTHDDFKRRVLRPLVKGVMRMAFSGISSRLILQNPDDLEVLRSARIVEESTVRVIRGSGVDCTRFAPDGQGRTRHGAFRVVLAARLLWDKGIAEYIEAARLLRGEGRNIEFIIAGSPDAGNPVEVPEIQVREWAVEGLVTWLGHVSDMPAMLRSVDVAVLPSYREGLPKGLIEAAACGLPLVTTDVPGCREVVTDDIDGLLVPVRDGKALAAAIARLHDSPELRHRLGNAARRKAIDHFDERLVIDRTIQVYRELVEA